MNCRELNIGMGITMCIPTAHIVSFVTFVGILCLSVAKTTATALVSSRQHISLVIAAFITFVGFAGLCLLLSPKLLQLFLLPVDLTIAIPYIIILLSRTS